MVIKNICILVIWTKVALALEGLTNYLGESSKFGPDQHFRFNPLTLKSGQNRLDNFGNILPKKSFIWKTFQEEMLI